MKLVYAIIRNDNEDDVTSALMQEGFTVTRLSSTGGFLRKGSTTLMIALQDEQLEHCIEIIKQHRKHALCIRIKPDELYYHAYECGDWRSDYYGSSSRKI